MWRTIPITSGLALGALASAAWAAGPSPEDVAAKAKPIACESLTTAALGLANVEITSAKTAPADKGLPAACVIEGLANPRVGIDGRHYALGFEMRLPLEWNGRFLHQVNGGNDGVVIPAIGDPNEINAYGGRSALARGFAVLSSDEGHSGADPANSVYGLEAGAAFGFDPQARDDYGYSGDMTLGPVGKAIIAKFYGEAPARSYMFGCSNGGRHAMVAATRMGDQYDGFVAGDPGFNLPRAAIQHAWDAQSFAMIDPDIKKSFSPADMSLISRKVLEVCEKLDGVEDGMVADIRACQKAFHLADLQCPGEKTDECLSKTQVDGAEPRLRRTPEQQGRAALFAMAVRCRHEFGQLAVLESILGNSALERQPADRDDGRGFVGHDLHHAANHDEGRSGFAVGVSRSLRFRQGRAENLRQGCVHYRRQDCRYKESAWEFMTPPDADDPKLEKLRASGHKISLYHGQSDGVFSFEASANWIENSTPTAAAMPAVSRVCSPCRA